MLVDDAGEIFDDFTKKVSTPVLARVNIYAIIFNASYINDASHEFLCRHARQT